MVHKWHLPFNRTLTLHKNTYIAGVCVYKEFTMSNKQSTNYSDKYLRTLPSPLVSLEMC